MADKKIGELPVAQALEDDSLLAVYQGNETRSIRGELIARFAREATEGFVGQAAESAKQAAASREAAEQSASDAEKSRDEAGQSAETAEKAKVDAEAALEQVNADRTAAETAAATATEKAAAAGESAAAAKESEDGAAKIALADAETAKSAAQTAQAEAETARDAAEASEATATQKATEAAQSADTAKQYSGNPPRISDKKTWEIWNAESGTYEDTGQSAKGNVLFAWFYIDPSAGTLYMVTDEDYTGPTFRLENGELEVVLYA